MLAINIIYKQIDKFYNNFDCYKYIMLYIYRKPNKSINHEGKDCSIRSFKSAS